MGRKGERKGGGYSACTAQSSKMTCCSPVGAQESDVGRFGGEEEEQR